MPAPRDELLQAILENPDDDQLRLVYADWLEERGDSARAEFIRLQIEYSTLPCIDPRVSEICRRWTTLLNSHQRAWLTGFPRWLRLEFRNGRDMTFNGCSFSRGFVNDVSNSADVVIGDLDHIVRLTPLTEITLIGDYDAGLPALLRSPSMAHIRRLNWWGYERGPLHEASRLALHLEHAAPLPGLKQFLVGWVHIGPEGARCLARAPILGSLTDLHIGRALLSDAGATALGGAAHLTQLQLLNLTGNEIGDAGLAGLAAATGLPGLQTLDLAWNEIGDAGVAALAGSPLLNQLHTLELQCNLIGDAGVVALAGSPSSRNLRRLGLSNMPFTEAGVRALAKSPYLEQIESLSVRRFYSWKADELSKDARAILKQRFGERVHL